MAVAIDKGEEWSLGYEAFRRPRRPDICLRPHIIDRDVAT
jgi:hypothetical protein